MNGRSLTWAMLAIWAATSARAAGPEVRTCGGQPCPPVAQSPVEPHCRAVPKGCVCEYSPRTKTWGAACPKKPR